MAARAKGFDPDWDPMQEDYNNSNYDPQYADDNNSGFVNLDHSRLYITNIPKALNDEGLQTAFSKFGTLVEVYVSKDPQKRYGLVGFETPGEAKLAMMKLNRTEPLGLNINIAHKKKTTNRDSRDNRDSRENRYNRDSRDSHRDNRDGRDTQRVNGRDTQRDNRDRGYGGQRDREWRGNREETSSVGSRSSFRKQEDLANGDNMEEIMEDVDVGLNTSLDPDVNLELENLKLEHLKLQEAQLLCKHRMLLLKQAERKSSSTSRCILPNGRIVVRNVDKSETVRDTDASLGAGAGDSRVGNCVACGERAAAFCGGCGVTPYCGASCQRRDWSERHRKVCHNLKRTSGGAAAISARADPAPELEPTIPLAPPLRRPRSPEPVKRDRRDEDSGSDRAPPRKFGPPGAVTTNAPVARGGYRNARGGMGRSPQEDRNDNRTQQSRDYEDKPSGRNYDRSDNRGVQNRSDNAGGGRFGDRYGNRGGGGAGGGGRYDNKAPVQEEEEWGAKAESKPAEPKPAEPLPMPTFKPKSPQVQPSEPVQPKPAVAKETPREVRSVPTAVITGVAAAPAKPVVPKNSIVDFLQVNGSIQLTVDTLATECLADAGFVCLVLNEDHSSQYMQLLESFGADCEKSEIHKPQPGDLFAYLNPSDGGWYRARCLGPDTAALIDASKLIQRTASDNCRRVPADYVNIPEFSCLLRADKVKVSDTLICTVLSKSGGVLNISIADLATEAPVGNGTVQRWTPRVDYPAPAPPKPVAATSTAVASAGPTIPEVPRPPVTNKSKVILVDVTEPSRLFVHSADLETRRQFDEILTEVALYGSTATPLEEPPTVGQTVVAKFSDGVHYRALCKRYSSKLKKYLLEYIEYGNVAVGFLDELYPCPIELDLSARPTLVSQVTLQMTQKAFTPAAQEYLDKLKNEELILTIPSGEKSAPSGSAIRLTVERSGEDVNRAVDTLCTPEWQKLLARGGDVLEVPSLFLQDLKYEGFPEGPVELEITDCSTLQNGLLAGHTRGAPHVLRAFALTTQLTEYCNSELCRDPYLPKVEELCIAKCPRRNQWLRAALVDQKNGAGGTEADLLFFDYGNLDSQSVALIRKMMPEFVKDIPAAANMLDIKDFPENPTPEQVRAAQAFMKMSDKGTGILRVASAVKQAPCEYLIDAPQLIQAMLQAR